MRRPAQYLFTNAVQTFKAQPQAYTTAKAKYLKTVFVLLLTTLAALPSSCGDNSDTSTQSTGTQGSGGNGAGGNAGCSPGTTEACYSGPAQSVGIGICTPGTRMCNESGTDFGPCIGEVLPTVDDCKTEADEDCNGEAALCPGEAYWAKSAGDGSDQRVSALAFDSAGNIIVAGNFVGTIDLGTGPLQSAGGSDIFVAKFDSKGNALFSQRFGAVADQTVNAIALDSMDNIWLTGDFQNAIDFGGGTWKSAGEEDVFVAKLDSGGAHLFSNSYGDIGFQSGRSIALNAQNQVTIIATVVNTIDFGGGALASLGSTDIALASFSADGNHAWSKIFGGPATDTPNDLAINPIDSKGEITIAGGFIGSIDFGKGALMGKGGTDVFMARFGSDGTLLWSKAMGEVGEQSARTVALDGSGQILLAGAFLGSLDLGGGAMNSNGSEDIFIAKFNAMGDHLWSKSFGDAAQQVPRAMATDTMGRVFITGSASGDTDFGGGVLMSAGLGDVFLAEFDENGNHLLSRLYGNNEDQSGRDIAADSKGNAIVVGGTFRGEIEFSPVKLVSAGAFDLFIAKLAP